MRITHERARSREAGVTMIEMVIAITVLSVGLVSLAHLFIVASFNNYYAIATSGGVNDAQRLVEYWKARAAVNGITDAEITSSTWDEDANSCAAFASLTAEDAGGYDPDASAYKPSVWVFDDAGALVGAANPAWPADIDEDIELKAPSANSRYVYIRMVPKSNDPRYGQEVTLSAVVGSNKDLP